MNEDFPWFEFLHLRARMIRYFRKRGDNWEQIASQLSCDPVQVQLIHMTPLKDVPGAPEKEKR